MEIFNNLFSSGDEADDLINFAEKLDGLGGAIEALFLCGDQMAILANGKALGLIVCDYAQAVKHIAEGAYHAISKHYHMYPDNPVGQLKHECDEIQKDYRRHKSIYNTDRLNETIEKVGDLLEEIQPLYGIRNKLCALLNPDQGEDDINEDVSVELEEAS